MKFCPKCKSDKDINSFSPDKNRKDGKAGHCRDCNNKIVREWKLCNTKLVKEQNHEWYSENKEHSAEQRKRWRHNNKERSRTYYKDQRKNNIQVKLAWLLRSRLGAALKNNSKRGSAVRDLGCSIEFLKQYIESKFLPGMTWANHGFGNDKWNIDHIIPLDSFDLSDRNQLLNAVHYTNLQPLWQPDNFRKGSKII